MGAGITVDNTGNGVLLLEGPASLAAYQAVLASVTYRSSSDDPTANNTKTSRSISWSVTDADSDGAGAATTTVPSTIDITAVNDPPTADHVPALLTVIEDTSSPLDLSAILVTDPDSSTNNITVKLKVTDGQLAVSGGGGVSVTGSNSAEMTLTGPVSNIDSFFNTAATASEAVDEIRYTGLADDNGTAAVSLTIEANDGGFVGSGGGGNTLLGTVQINITAVNDEPSFVIRDSVDSSIDGRVSPAAAGNAK